MRARRRTLAAAAVVALAGGVVGVWGYGTQRWGCPSYAEASRPRTTDEVAEAFRQTGITLERAPEQRIPLATVFRRVTAGATLVTVVCVRLECAFDLRRIADPRRPFHQVVAFLNVWVSVSASDARALRAALRRVDSVASRLSPVSRDDRCFPV